MPTDFETLINSRLDYWTNRSHAITDMFRNMWETGSYSIERDSTKCPTFLRLSSRWMGGNVYVKIYDVRPDILKAHNNEPICIEYDMALVSPSDISLQAMYYRLLMFQARHKTGEKYSPEIIHLLHTLPDTQSSKELQQEYQQYFKNMCTQCCAKEGLQISYKEKQEKELDALIQPIIEHLKEVLEYVKNK